ncbi:MAG TPA: hypothetical protein VN812_00975 [Candidatus Acidoferrales bacterium]|nr:hypothetical protein [Candidatus Acidoferrales bacterium]
MRVLLRVTAVLSLAWAVLLLGFKEQVLNAEQLSPQVCALANGLGIADAVLAYVFWNAAYDPAAHRGPVYGAIMLMTMKMANDLYELLVLLPPERTLVSLADLVLSIALLVGILEALPRTLAARSAS